MQTIVHIKDGLWSNLAAIAFALGLAVLAVWLDSTVHGEVSIVVWFFSGVFVLFCFLPIKRIRKPRSPLLAIDGNQLLWRINNRKTGAVALERRVPLRSIRGLKWVVPIPADSRRGRDYANAQLRFITDERSSLTLPDEFCASAYRGRIEAALKIVEELTEDRRSRE